MAHNISHNNARHLGRLAVACGAAVMAFGLAANATAAPDDDTWDIEEYDNCMKQTVRIPDLCCVDSGGTPTSDPEDTQADGAPNCYAPPGTAQEAGQQPVRPLPPNVIGDLPTVQINPAQPPPIGPAQG